jgi:SAM-dependent methyltransferase
LSRWDSTRAPRGDAYDARWRALAAAGHDVHGEANLVDELLRDQRAHRVLDAGCGTGRVAIELSRRGFDVVGVDLDRAMLAAARQKAPELTWVEADLAHLDRCDALPGAASGRGFDAAVLAGNVMIFLEPGMEGRVLDGLARQVDPNGLLIAGFQVQAGRLSLDRYDQLVADAGFDATARWATWDREPFRGGDYAVSVHSRRMSSGE